MNSGYKSEFFPENARNMFEVCKLIFSVFSVPFPVISQTISKMEQFRGIKMIQIWPFHTFLQTILEYPRPINGFGIHSGEFHVRMFFLPKFLPNCPSGFEESRKKTSLPFRGRNILEKRFYLLGIYIYIINLYYVCDDDEIWYFMMIWYWNI